MWELGPIYLYGYFSTFQIIFKFYIIFIRYTRLCNTCLEITGVLTTYCTVVVLSIIYLGRRIIGRLLGTSACDGEQILLLQSLGLSITPVGAVYFRCLLSSL